MSKKFKRLFFDIETSPNIGFFWQPGYQISIGPENIIKERAIICICYKWEGEKKVHEVHWNKGEDKALLQKFVKIMNSADEIIGHNSDQFDTKWIRARCIFHGIEAYPDYVSVDTLKLSRRGFRFNSNKLDYIAQFLGLGAKLKTDYDLWKRIILNNDEKAMSKMIKYCKNDVIILEKVFNKLKNYSKHKTHVAVLRGGAKIDCPECGSDHTTPSKHIVTASGIRKTILRCQDCGKHQTILASVYNKAKDEQEKKHKV